MLSICGIDHVAINVYDIDKSVAFYTQVLGLRITQREPSKPGIEYFLDCGPSLIGIIQADNLHDKHPFANTGPGANHFSLRVHAKNFDAMIERLQENHVKIEFAKKRPKSWSLYFYDPDGNKLEITSWPVEDGIPAEMIKKMIFDPASRAWHPYE